MGVEPTPSDPKSNAITTRPNEALLAETNGSEFI